MNIMWKKINWLSLFFIVVMSISSIAYAEVKIQKPGYTITLPDGWIEIPRYIIKDLKNAVAIGADAQRSITTAVFSSIPKITGLSTPTFLYRSKNSAGCQKVN